MADGTHGLPAATPADGSAAAAGSARGRLAPSPTGLLHLGNAWSFMLAWLDARTRNGSIILRLEDIDPARSRPAWREAAERDLEWLGMDWDEGPGTESPAGPFLQSERGALYERVLAALSSQGRVYPCYCTRKELRMLAGAPHGAADGLGDAGAPYPGTCRNLTQEERARKEREGRRAALRLRCPDGEDGRIAFEDRVLGRQSMTLGECGGDFALRRSDGVWAYQLAVVADDIAMGVTSVVRGRDILFSTPRQILLHRLLGARPPEYAHVPLLLDEQGERLAKRHGSLSLAALRERGVRPEEITGLLAGAAGLNPGGRPAALRELSERIRSEGGMDWKRLAREGVPAPASLMNGTSRP